MDRQRKERRAENIALLDPTGRLQGEPVPEQASRSCGRRRHFQEGQQHVLLKGPRGRVPYSSVAGELDYTVLLLYYSGVYESEKRSEGPSPGQSNSCRTPRKSWSPIARWWATSSLSQHSRCGCPGFWSSPGPPRRLA